jgi:hypothetical protein
MGMSRKRAGLIVICAVAVQILSCSSGQQLESITIAPSSEAFGSPDPQLNVQATAYGNYVHPPATKNITDQVTWSTDTPQVAAVTNTGLVSPAGLGCGVATISATVKTNKPTGNVVVGTMSVTVDGSEPGCPGGQ